MTWYQRRGNKYGAKRSVYNGYPYQSKKEAGYAAELDMRLKAGDIKAWERQVRVELRGENGTKICDYIVDFLVTLADGTLEYVEVKGFETPEFKLKRKLFEDKIGKWHDCRYVVVK